MSDKRQGTANSLIFPFLTPTPNSYSNSSRRDFTAEDAEGEEQKGEGK